MAKRKFGIHSLIFDDAEVIQLLRAAIEREGEYRTRLRDAMALTAPISMNRDCNSTKRSAPLFRQAPCGSPCGGDFASQDIERARSYQTAAGFGWKSSLTVGA